MVIHLYLWKYAGIEWYFTSRCGQEIWQLPQEIICHCCIIVFLFLVKLQSSICVILCDWKKEKQSLVGTQSAKEKDGKTKMKKSLGWILLIKQFYSHHVTGLRDEIQGFFMNLCQFYPIFYTILCHSLMKFTLFHDTFSSISCYSMLAISYIIAMLLYYSNMKMRILNII